MDELEISGKRYISTRRAAREHGYHSDYMGQLIRGKKVAGEKVGRAWYIDEESLAAYLGKAPAPAVPVEQNTGPAPEPVVVQQLAPEPEPQHEHEPEPEPEPVPLPTPVALHVEVAPAPVEIKKEEPAEIQIPIHKPAPAIEEIGGLRYAQDDSPSLPLVTRMPQSPQYAQAQQPLIPRPPAKHFPYMSLSLVGLLTILTAAFASNFVSATITSEPGKTAIVTYAIHW
jgi:outer membrane biosynthesis protein TonB